MNVFDFVNNISTSNNSIWEDGISDKEYNAFMANRALSQYYDTVMFAQAMNERSNIAPKLQYDFYLTAITNKRKRFAKWHKPEKLEKATLLANHYGINIRTVENYLELLSDADIDNIMETLEKGGRNGRK